MKWDDDVRRGGYEDLDSEMRTYLLTYLLTYSMEQSPFWEANTS